MRRHRKHSHENHERWLVSYADFITLLFAFFVVLFASGQTDRDKTKQVAESVREGFEKEALATAVSNMIGGPNKKLKKIEEPRGHESEPPKSAADAKAQGSGESLKQAYEQLSTWLKDELSKGAVSMTLDSRGLVISLREAAFFVSGDDQIPAAAIPTINKISNVLGKLPHQIRFEGHTDAVPIATVRFPDNWSLSSARATAMLHMFLGKGFDPRRFAAVGYADTAPLSDNDSEEGRARNRRVDIVVLRHDAAGAEAPGWGKSKPSKPSAAH